MIRIQQALRFLCLIYCVLFAIPGFADFELSNGSRGYIGDSFTISLLGSEKLDHDELRSLMQQFEALSTVEKNLQKFGLNFNRKVHIRFYADADFPARDLWLSAGIRPDQQSLAAYEEDVGLVFSAMSGYEFAHLIDKLNDKYFFLKLIPNFVSQKILTNPGALNGKTLDEILSDVKKSRIEMEKGLARPVISQKYYQMSSSAVYFYDKLAIWIPVTKTAALHRYLDTTVHEYGHHGFYMLVRQVVDKLYPKRKWTDLQLFFACKSLSAINEFFADYVAVSNGYSKCINLHHIGKSNFKPPHEVKRVFSQKRTLKDYLEMNAASWKNEYWLDEDHNKLNPMRSFVWQLRFAIGDSETDRLVFAATRAAISDFFKEGVTKYKRKHLTQIGWGCFILEDYPNDIVGVNIRFLKFLHSEARKLLNAEQLGSFDKIASEIFVGYYPFKEN